MSQTKSEYTVGSHFEGKDKTVRQTYDRLLKNVRKFGRVIEEPKKTSIHLVNSTAFAGLTTRTSSLVLTVKSDRKLSSPRVHRSEQTSTKRFHHEIKLTSPDDVDLELLKWLKNAYALSE